MSARVRVDRDPRGRLVAAKVALHPRDEATLRREAELLQAARHPGVVECLGVVDGVGGPELLTAWVGPRSLALAQPVTVRAAGTVVAALARTVAVLHERGLVHHAIDATHVLLDGSGRPILCSFAQAGPAGEAAPAGSARRPSVDVGALGALLGQLVRTARRGGRRSARADALLARRLIVVADQVAVAAPGAPTTARALAAALDDVLGPVARDVPAHARRRTRGRLPAIGFGALLALTVLATAGRIVADGDTAPGPAASATLPPRPAAEPPVAEPPVAEPPSPTAGPPGPTAGAPGQAASPGSTERSGGSLPTSGSPRPPVVVVDGQRYEVGAPGDQAAVADWRCDGTPIAVLHRPDTGAVFVFDRWADADHEVAEAPVTTVAPGGHLLVPAHDEECPGLAVVHPGGRIDDVALPSSSAEIDARRSER